MATKKQIQVIHAIIHKLGMSGEDYRQMLLDNYRVTSSKDLTDAQASFLINRLSKTHSHQSDKQNKPKKYDDLSGRSGYLATPRQLRLIESLWMSHPKVREKSETALNHFIFRITGTGNIRWITKEQVSKIITAIRNLQ